MINVAPIWLPEKQQQNYRAVLEAISRPGHCKKLYFDGDDVDRKQQAFIALLASLLDNAVTFSDPHGLVHEDDMTLLQTQRVATEQADFIVCQGNEIPSFQPKLGTLPSPELSATLVLLVTKTVAKIHETNHQGELKLCLSGPGVNGLTYCTITGLHRQWLNAREEWVSRFPLGVDMLLVDDSSVMALPRTSKVEII